MVAVDGSDSAWPGYRFLQWLLCLAGAQDGENKLERRPLRRKRFEGRAEVLGLKKILSRRGCLGDFSSSNGCQTSTTAAMFWRLSFLAISAGLLFGVDIASIGAALEGMAQELGLEDNASEWVVSGAKGGAVFGGLFGGALMVSRGRRTSIRLSALPFFVGPLLILTAQSFWQAFVGRLLMGLGFGLASVATPSYLSEVVVPVHRGLFEAMYELGIASGMLLAALLNLLLQALSVDGQLGNLSCWRYQAGLVPCAFAVPLLLLSFTVPESPRWLMQTATPSSLLASLGEIACLGRPGARQRLETVKSWTNCENGSEPLEALDAEAFDAEEESEKASSKDDLIRLWDEKHKALGNPLFSRQTTPDEEVLQKQRTCGVLLGTFIDVKDILTGKVPSARQGLTLALAAAVLNQACASTSILIYAQKLLETAGVQGETEQDAQSTIIIAAKLVGVILGLFLVERVTRKALLAAGGAGSAMSLALLLVGMELSNNVLLMIGMGFFVLCFYSTWGIGYWAVVVEVTAVGGPRYASAAQAMSTATLFFFGWLTSLTFVQVMSLGSLGILVYIVVAVMMFAYGRCWLPETSGHSLEECAYNVEHQVQGDLWDSDGSDDYEVSSSDSS
eukprot:s1128_g18.t1